MCIRQQGLCVIISRYGLRKTISAFEALIYYVHPTTGSMFTIAVCRLIETIKYILIGDLNQN